MNAQKPLATPIKVLVVDDVPQNLVAIAALLARPDLEVMKAASGTEALELLLLEDVAVALVDVQMPQMDGFELAELLRGSERTRGVPLIFLTASASDPVRTFRGYETGAVDFLHKPIDPHVLKSKVEVFVELHAQRRRMAEQLEQLKQALKMNEMFVAVLSHDLRNPLSAVMNGANLIPMLSSDEKVVNTAARIRSSGARMVRMVEQLLDIARVRGGRIEMKPAEGDLRDLVGHLVEELGAGGERARIEVSVVGDTRAAFDPDRIAAAVSNLLGNALQHGADGSKIRVHIDGTRENRLLLRVSNDGVIAPGILATIFEPFHSSGPQSRSSGGLGLGLFIVNEFVKAHGGRVDARSEPSAGTSFEIDLPRAPRLVPVGTLS
ncbi:MAG TPA: hybrid sensor histidine kinase/response regulator [Usitatibacter sp.]|jgi:signal transduction histidine kinase|nr:hybrid sensor histidine kinase/response regulator [Usitatibacter sp.]